MEEVQRNSPLLIKYLKLYQDNPDSTVFAPLAETYRKLGMSDKALEVLKTGLRRHPEYATGYLSLAGVYFDQGRFELAYSTLKPFVSRNLENITMLKLFASICEKLGEREEALDSYKYLLFLSPRNGFFIQKVQELSEVEAITYEAPKPEGAVAEFDIQRLEETSPETHEDEWVQVSLQESESSVQIAESAESQWAEKELQPERTDENTEEFWEMNSENILKSEDELVDTEKENLKVDHLDGSPVITHTLVDLYLSQGLKTKAVGVLEKILENNPDDSRTRKRLEELKNGSSTDKAKDLNDEGHQSLMDRFDSAMGYSLQRKELIEKKFMSFLDHIKAKAASC